MTLTFDFLGSEAGFNNSFWFNGVELFATGGNTNSWCTVDCTVPLASVSVGGLSTGLLDFKFVTPVGEAVNGSNPDNTTPTVPNFFLSFDGANPKAGSGTSVVLWLDDGGADGDDNHDDMAVRIRIDNGSISAVPLPAAGWLLIAGLGGLGVVARRKKS
ncbi:VPLPA-CTERM sorting domain-containing protein [Rhodovulum strictum]|nr:VPLPA-CTERM sorting domain-containing protein [Rhodovulum strictum]